MLKLITTISFGCMYICQDSFHALPLPMIVCMSDSLQMEPFVSPSQYTCKHLLTLHTPESYTSCKLGCELYHSYMQLYVCMPYEFVTSKGKTTMLWHSTHAGLHSLPTVQTISLHFIDSPVLKSDPCSHDHVF